MVSATPRPTLPDDADGLAGSDTLSDLLHTVRLTGAAFFDFEASAPWAEMQPAGTTIANSVLPGVQHLISYHAVMAGCCFGGLVDGERIRLEAGDVIVFPHGDAHVMSSAPGVPARLDLGRYGRPGFQLPVPVRALGNGGERSRLVCGFLGCDVRPFHPLIRALPRVLHVSDRRGPN